MNAAFPFPEVTITALLQQAGIADPPLSCVRLGGGGNNRSYRLETAQGAFLLKAYFLHPDDPRDRAGMEYAFLAFCRERGIGRVPLPLGMLREEGLALHSWVEGRPVSKESLTENDIAEAVDFIAALARESDCREAQSLPPAADACFSMREHLGRIENRLQTLQSALRQAEKQTDDIAREAAEFVDSRIMPSWLQVRDTIEAALGEALRQSAPPTLPCMVSPSDFGFHNALRTDKGLVFVDFEYAGRDDPAKLLCDFVCQPAVPVPDPALELMADAIKHHAGGLNGELGARARLLLPAHRLKWCCIMLNVFRGSAAARRGFARGEGREARAEQLRKSIRYFETHCRCA